ncbi:hypothetical protein FISHEDRAFT_47031 [Fistulina hepatica ATCC 64428]|uniref:NADH dehydrogenase [ubiquinone] 1 beta subcomplex subunit 9 n=1 Tax=Fistulina hepatica ATCC 64428 TaxID=1128425 RepID=A0A0D7A6E9_9AGAR|nr:hypothetical protein FISHEDRAFT_47031 [Fistulina hepatica ATCC 64428]
MSTQAAFRSAHRSYVQSLYRRKLKNMRDWCIDLDLWRAKAMQIRADFEANRNVHDPRLLARILAKAEADLAEKKHPDPYIPPGAPDGTTWYVVASISWSVPHRNFSALLGNAISL